MSRILLDDPAHSGGSSQLGAGSVANDGTGDPARTGALKLKQWATDLNSMTTDLYAGNVAASSLSPTQMSATQDDYTPPSYVASATNRLLLNPASGGTTLNGLLAAADGFKVLIVNTSTTDTITFAHLAGSSSAANRFSCPGGTASVLSALSATYVIYVANQWVLL